MAKSIPGIDSKLLRRERSKETKSILKTKRLSMALLTRLTNFASTITSKTSKRKQPPVAQNELQPKPRKQRNTSQSQPDVSKVPSFVWGWCVVWWHSYRNWILLWEETVDVQDFVLWWWNNTSCTWWPRSSFSILNHDLKLLKKLSLISMLSCITNHFLTWFGSLKKILIALHLYPTIAAYHWFHFTKKLHHDNIYILDHHFA